MPLNRRRCGRIAARFNRSFDIKLDAYLLNFNLNRKALHPLGVLIPKSLLQLVRPGQPVTLDQNLLRFDNHIFQLQPLIQPPLIPDFPEQLDLSSLYKALLLRVEKSSLTAGLLGTDSTGPADALIDATLRLIAGLKNPPLDLQPHLPQFGQGSGLTPAFDDFCAGLIFADRQLPTQLISLPENLADRLVTRTTRTSCWQLEFARRGRLNLGFELLFVELLENRATIANCLAACNFGHTSGSDILAGIYYRLQATDHSHCTK